MGIRRTVLALLIGAVLGVVVVLPALWRPAAPSPSPQAVARDERELVARRLMARVARDFVASRPPSRTYDGSHVFYDVPLNYGDGLCRIRSYAFANSIATGRPFDRREYPHEKLVVEDVYGVWAEPGSAQTKATDPDQACARYRDFEHLITSEDGSAVSRVASVLASASREARAGHVGFKVTCLDRRDLDAGMPCDGLALLRGTRAKHIQHVGPDEEDGGVDASDPAGRVYRNQVQIDVGPVVHSCGKWESLIYDLTIRQASRRVDDAGGDLLAVAIYRDEIC